MARTAAPHSASSQFFINVNDNQFLDFPGQDGWGYCVFGEVVAGKDVVDKMKLMKIPYSLHDNVIVELIKDDFPTPD